MPLKDDKRRRQQRATEAARNRNQRESVVANRQTTKSELHIILHANSYEVIYYTTISYEMSKTNSKRKLKNFSISKKTMMDESNIKKQSLQRSAKFPSLKDL